jgi:Trk K+ transport system NAD-binding subunit
MFNQDLVNRLGRSARNIIALSTSALTGPVLALLARSGAVLGAFTAQNKRMQVAEILIRARSPWRGLALHQVLAQHQVILIGHLPGGSQYRLMADVDCDATLAPGDRLIVCGEPAAIALLRASGQPELEPELLWAGALIRFWRMTTHALLEVDLAVKICGAILVFVVVTSTVVFHLTMKNDTIPDAFFRTISVMATMADMGLRELEPGGWQRVYVGLLRMSGAALLAAFTAILTNFLLRAQLKGALEVRRIPEGGHIVVCGLGNIGYRVAEELLAEGENVVAVERAADCPFITAARRKKVAVMVSDATVTDVLNEAKVGTAKAVVAATDNELANLEIALLAREINPRQRVVLRLTDTQLALTLRDAADIRLAVSVPNLAAPAFVAALFGDQVHCLFFVEDHLLALVNLTVDSPQSRLLGRLPRDLAAEYRLLPVCVVSTAGAFCDRPTDESLTLGDCLTVVVELSDLQKLLQDEATPLSAG